MASSAAWAWTVIMAGSSAGIAVGTAGGRILGGYLGWPTTGLIVGSCVGAMTGVIGMVALARGLGLLEEDHVSTATEHVCPGCGYMTRELTGTVCPECGEDFAEDRARWREADQSVESPESHGPKA